MERCRYLCGPNILTHPDAPTAENFNYMGGGFGAAVVGRPDIGARDF